MTRDESDMSTESKMTEPGGWQMFCRFCGGMANFFLVDVDGDNCMDKVVITCTACNVQDDLNAVAQDAIHRLALIITDDWETPFRQSLFEFQRGAPLPELRTNFRVKI